VTSHRYLGLVSRARSAASGPALAALISAKPDHQRFEMTGTDANVWPLSPQDWSTG
jgi:hypothetical protein